jgi:hypothetical protein
MGHERIGALPRTLRWRAIVGHISGAAISEDVTIELADLTLSNVRRRFEGLADEDSIQGAFRFLIALAVASRSSAPNDALEQGFGIHVDDQPSPLALAKAFQLSLDGYPNSEKSDLAAKALADALAQFSRDPRFTQGQLFGASPWDTWREADTGAGFCDLSRLYFSNLTERYLRYFLDREASALLGDPQRVTDFRQQLRATVDSISRHAFETSKITQSYAAGWFQKNAKAGMPSSTEIRGFLSFALHKIREELRREAGSA